MNRDGIASNLRDAYSHLIRKKVLEYLDSISAKFVHTYIGFHSEVSTTDLLSDLLERKIKIAVPVIQGESSTQFLTHSLLQANEKLLPGKFGVLEPADVREIPLEGLDAVIIPIVAFDGFGMRLGYGKGYYDRFLATLPKQIPRIGLAFSIQEVEKIPILPHDELINFVITEQSIFFFK